MKSAWPTTTELDNYLAGIGVATPTGIDTQDTIDAAVQTWESLVGVTPWKADATASDRTFTLRGETNLSIPPCVLVESVSIAGEELTVTTDWAAAPYGATTNSKPYTYIEFRNRYASEIGGVTISAKWGYQSTIFEDVWFAVRDLAIGNILMSAGMKSAYSGGSIVAGAIKEVRQADVTIKYTESGGYGQAYKNAQVLASRYRVRSL